MTYFQNLGTLRILETVQAKNFKLGMRIDQENFPRKKVKIRPKGVVNGSRDLLL